jgi:hypothetical protein
MLGSFMMEFLLIVVLAILVFLCFTGPDLIGGTRNRR